MALTFKQLGQALSLVTTWQQVYVVPANITTIFQTLDACNTTSGEALIRVCLVPSGGSPSEANCLIWDIIIPTKSSLTWAGNQAFKDSGSKLYVYASAAGVCFTASGLERT